MDKTSNIIISVAVPWAKLIISVLFQDIILVKQKTKSS